MFRLAEVLAVRAMGGRAALLFDFVQWSVTTIDSTKEVLGYAVWEMVGIYIHHSGSE